MGAAAVPPDVVAAAAAAAGAYLRREGEEEAALLRQLAATAVGVAEAFVGRALVVRGHEDALSPAPGWQALAAMPVTAIAGATALPALGEPFVLGGGGYQVDIDAEGVGWVRIVDAGGAGRVAVAYGAGLASGWDALPPAVAQGVVMLVAHLFENRGEDRAPPAAVAALWRPWRRMRLQVEHRR